MSKIRSRVIMVGAVPPPVHGMAAVNSAVRAALQQAGVEPRVINMASPSLNRSPLVRLARLPRVLCGLVWLSYARGLRDQTLYMSVSGGLGQLYELAFVLLARLRGMRIFLHHHSFAYLDVRSRLPTWLTHCAGIGTVHVAQCPRMAELLKTLYGVQHVVPISNAVFLLRCDSSVANPQQDLLTLGFISNVSVEKGVFEFLDLLAAAQDAGLPLRGRLAGPFQDKVTEQLVRERLSALTNVEYVGAKYGSEKDAFFAHIDALIFPTRYKNETEGIVNLEAMRCGIPVIAYGRGCIPEIVSADCGKIINPTEPFVPAALAQIKAWLGDHDAFEAASKAATRCFAEFYAESEQRWQVLLGDLTGSSDQYGRTHTTETEKSSSQT